MNTPFAPRHSIRIKGFALATVLTLAMLVSIDLLATFDLPAPQMAQGKTSSHG